MSALEKRILRKKQSQQEAHGEDKDEEEKQKSLIPYREWNASDFMGKYHGTKIKNKLAPIPGTQLRVEKEHEEAKQFYEEYLKQVQQDHFRKAQTKVTVKKQAATLQTNVYFDTLFNTTIDRAEAILNEKERLLNNANASAAFDELTTIDKFRKFVAQGKAHYIGMAVSNGYKSIDYQDPNDHGNTCLHIACRRGYVDVVEELLKYKANPDLPNEYGNYPIHEAWMFWKTDTHLRTREERLDQEDRTAEIVLKLLAYGAWVDARDQKLQTPLHIACRLGTTRTVKVLLTFFADIDVTMKDGLTALDIAEEFEQWETLRLLQSWVHIRPHFVHTDFHVIWRKFLMDYEAIISNNKTAEQILSELELEQNAHYMQRMAKKHMVLIDDPLLQQAFLASEATDGVEQKVPKPWEPGWRRYVKQTKMAGVMDLKTRLEALKTKLKDSESKKTGQLMPRQPNDNDRRRHKLPDRPTPLTWQEQQEALTKKKALLIAEQEANGDDDGGGGGEEEENDGDGSSDGRLGGSISGNGSVAIARSQIYSIQFGQVGNDKEATALRMVDPRPQLVQRRCRFAQQVALDAKFLPFTKRLTQDSALSLSLRTAQAPIANTEEDGTIMRTILNKGVEFDRLEKYQAKESLHDILGIKTTPKKNHLGAYCEATKMSEPNARDALYDQLSNFTERNVVAGAMTSPAGKTAASAAGGAASSKPSTASASTRDKTAAAAAKLDPDVKKKIDLVGGDRHNPRPRYVDAALLPAKVEPTKVELMMRAAAKAEEEKLLQKANLSSEATRAEARNQIAASIAAASRDENDNASTRSGAAVSVDSNGDNDDDNNSVEVSQAKRRAAAQRQRALRKLFLSDTKVKYGEGRLLSSHHMRGKLPEPWTSVDDKYKTVVGDRTV